jgi:hypothetical protein
MSCTLPLYGSRARICRSVVVLVAAFLASGALAAPDCGTWSLPAAAADPPALTSATVAAPPAAVGDKLSFYVHIPAGRVRATLRHVGARAAFWVDDRHADVVRDETIRALAAEFDNRIYGPVRSWFGSEWLPGVDGDGRLTVLLHDIEGNQSAAGFGGYFSAVDELPHLSTSNARELLYLDVFAVRDYDRFRLHSLFAHEFAHMVNWHQRRGASDERWLEEGRAAFAEWAVYGNVHVDFVNGYLAEPQASLTTANTFETWYGAGFLLLLYCYDQFGGRDFAAALSRSPLRGMEAMRQVLDARGVLLEDAVRFWHLANLVNDTSAHPRAGYRNLRRDIRVPATALTRHAAYPASAAVDIGEWATRYVELVDLPPTWLLRIRSEEGRPYLASVWRPAAGVVSEMLRAPDGAATATFRGAVQDERATLILTAPVGQRISYTVAPGDGENGVVPSPRLEHRIPAADRLLPRRPLPAPPDVAASLRPREFLPFAGQVDAVAVSGDTLWATAGWGLLRFDIADRGNPRLLDIIPTVGFSTDVLADERLVIVAEGRAGISIYDAATAERLSTRPTTGSAGRLARSGDWLFVLNEDTGLRVLDISDPRGPLLVRQQFGSAGVDLRVLGDRLYVSDADGLQVYSLGALPDLPRLGRLETSLRGIAPVGGDIWGGTRRLVAVDVRNPNAMRVVRQHDTVGAPTAVDAVGTILVVAEGEGGISLVDVAQPRGPQTLARLPLPGDARGVARSSSWVYAATASDIAAIDAADPVRPTVTWRLSLHGVGRGIAWGRDVVLVAMGAGGLVLLDASTRSPFSTVPTAGNANAVRPSGRRAFVASDVGLETVDVSDVRRPQPDGVYAVDEPAADVAVSDDGRTAYLAARDVYALSLDGPAPRLLSRLSLDGYASALALSAGQLWVCALEGGVHALDVSNPAAIRVLAHVPTPGPARTLALDGDMLIVGAGVDVLALNVAGGRPPVQIARWDAGFDVRSVQARGGWVFAAGETSLAVWDARNVNEPRLLSRRRHLDWAGAIAVGEANLYVADLFGLRVFRRTDEGAPLAVDGSLDPASASADDAEAARSVLHARTGTNYPNPFNAETWIPFALSAASVVDVAIYDLSGRLVRRLHAGLRDAGQHLTRQRAMRWDGRNGHGEPVVSGVYIYRFVAVPADGSPAFITAGRMVLAR